MRRLLPTIFSVISMAAFCSALVGCTQPLAGQSCSVDLDCQDRELVCEDAECVWVHCSSDSDATVPPGHVCDESTGDVREPAGPHACPNGEVAEDATGDCVPAAADDGDCAPGEQEVGGQCVVSPCTDDPFDTCPDGFSCDSGSGDCLPGAQACGERPNPADEICETATGEIRDRCPNGGGCPVGQQCNQDDYCEPGLCTLPDGNECDGGSICILDECQPGCAQGCPSFETCNQRTGVCEDDPTFVLPASTTFYIHNADPVVSLQVPVNEGEVQIHTVVIDASNGMTFDTFVPGEIGVAVDGLAFSPSVIDEDTAYIDSDFDANYDEGDEIVIKLVSPMQLVVTLPDGGDRSADTHTSSASRTIGLVVPVSVPGEGLFPLDVTATQIDKTNGGRRDHLLPDPPVATRTFFVNVSGDADGDGAPDDQETEVWGTDPNNPDTDHDGASDKFEIDFGLPPNDHDFDRNGVRDGDEILFGSDPSDPLSVPEPHIRSRYWTPNLFGGATSLTSAPVLFDIGVDHLGAIWADHGSDRVFAAEIVSGVVAPAIEIFGPGDIPVGCGGFDSIRSLDGLGPEIILTVTCSANAQVTVLGGGFDGVGPLVVRAEPGDGLGGESIVTVHDATLAGSVLAPVLAVTGTRASGDFLALDPAPFDTLSLRATDADLGGTGFDPLQVEADGDVFVRTLSPPRIVRVDLAGAGGAGTSVVLDAASDASPFDSTQGLSDLGFYAVGGSGLAVEITATDARSGIALFDQTGTFVEIVAEDGRPIPGNTIGGITTGVRVLSSVSVDGDRAILDAQDQLNSNALYGHFVREDGTPSMVQKIFHAEDSHGATNANLLGGATGGRASRSLTSSRAMAGDLIATRTQYGADIEIAVFEPGPPIPRAVMLATRPAGSVTNLYRFSSSPPIFDFDQGLSTNSLSGAARNPVNADVRFSAGFSGAVDPAVGGGLSSYGEGDGPLVFVGQTANLTATPGLEFDPLGGLWASASVDDGSSSVLANIDPQTAVDTVIAPWFIAPATSVTGLDALAYIGGTIQAMWAFTGSVFDGTPGDVFEVDLVTAELVQKANLPETFANVVGAAYSEAGDLFVSTGGSGGGVVAWVDISALAGPSPPPGIVDLPFRVLADIQILNQSISDVVVIDADGDGIDDFDEAGLGTSATNADTDGDGLADGAEALNLPTSPTLADTDGDGLDDGEERLLLGTDPMLPDTDGDGADDGVEVAAGSDPLDPLDFPPTVVPVLGWPGLVGIVAILGASPLVVGAARRRRRD